MNRKRVLLIAFSLLGLLGISASLASARFGDFRFGAIVYSHSSGRFGSSWSFDRASEAQEQALSACNRPDCRTVVLLRNACGALARARNGAVVTAWSDSLTNAKRLASNRCTREWGNCKLICSVCSGGNEP
jgi:Domain of unknown function (DUF4189)